MHPPVVFALRCAFSVLCFLLMMVNCGIITKWYFEYRVIVKAGPLVPFDVFFPKLSLCFSLSSLLSPQPSDFFAINSSLFLNKSVRYLKQSTPDEKNVIDDCMFRDWQSSSILLSNETKCAEYFEVFKYVMQSYMCYRLTPKSLMYSLFDATHTLEQRRLLYQVAIKSPLNSGHKMCPMLHFKSVPYYDRVFSQEILPAPQRGGKFILSNDVYEYSRLRYPYSRCSEKPQELCYTQCVMNQMKKLGVIHYPATIFNYNDSLILPDYETKYHGRPYNEIHDEASAFCRTFCPPELDCHLTLSVTLISRVPTFKPGRLAFEVLSMSKPVTKYETSKETDFINYLTIIASVCSFSVGFSILSMLTFKFKRPNVKMMAGKLMQARVRVATIVSRVRPRRESDNSNEQGPAAKKCLPIFSLIIKLIAAIACSYQVYEILADHLKFRTRVQIDCNYWPRQAPPTLNICLFKDTDFVGASSQLNSTNYDSLLPKKHSVKHKKALDLLKDTYSMKEIIAGCRIPAKESSLLWALTLRDRNECLGQFIVSRYLIDDHVCFSLSLKNDTSMLQGSRKFAIAHPGLHYSVILNDTVARRKLRIILGDKTLPTVSKRYSCDIPARPFNRLFLISNQMRRLHSLPYPHDTRCRNQTSKADCIRLCLLNETVSRLNALPFGQVIPEETLIKYNNLKLITFNELMNPFVNREWREIEKSCISRCDFEPCELMSFKTVASPSHPSQFKLEVAVDSRAHPDEHTRVIARSSLYVMINQLLCCGNFWLGLVLLDLNPFKTKAMKIEERLISSFNRHLESLYSDLIHLRKVVSATPFFNRLLGSLVIEFSVMKTVKTSLLALLLSSGCAAHLYYCTSNYMTYPTIMITYSRPDESSSAGYELSVCSSVLETLVPESVEAYYNRKISRKHFDLTLDSALTNSTVGSLMKSERIKLNSLDACSFRGVDEHDMSNHTRDVSNRLFIAHGDCSSHFYSKLSTVNGFLCHRFGMKHEGISEKLIPLNRPQALLILKMRAENLTSRLSVAISKRDYVPYYSSFWSPIFVKPNSSMKIKLTYVKYEQNILRKPYNNGFESVGSIRCFHDCMNLHLRPFGLGVIGSLNYGSTRDYRYPTKAQLKDNVFREKLEQTKQRCRERCVVTIGYVDERTLISFTTTSLLEFSPMKNTGTKQYIEFFLIRTDSPVTQVTIMRQWSPFELVINCGSIISIWFGISALFFDPLVKDKVQVNVRVIDKIDRLLRRINL